MVERVREQLGDDNDGTPAAEHAHFAVIVGG